MQSNILIWNQDAGFFKINEGTGDNLLDEDIEEGYIDYIVVTELEYNGDDFEEFDGGDCLLRKLYQDKFNTVDEVIQHLIDSYFIPDVNYMILYAR